MSVTANLAPGTIVPRTGEYKCEFCGEGGMASFFAAALENQGFGMNVSKLKATSRQGTTVFFEAGRTFSSCPTCGPATGWTLVEKAGEATGRQAARHRQSVSESCVCDVCNRKVNRPDGYLLTTRQVVGTPAYWRHYFQHHQSELAGMGILTFDEFRRSPDCRASCGGALARQSTAWMVCEKCVEMFSVDRAKAHSYAGRWWEDGRAFRPPGTGSVPLSAIDMGETGERRASSETYDVAKESRPASLKKWWEFWK